MRSLKADLNSLLEWELFRAENPWIFSQEYIDHVVERVRMRGFHSPFFGFVPPDAVEIDGNNWRETIATQGCSSRVRAMLDQIVAEPTVELFSKILMLEAVTPFALHIRGRYPLSIGTEYIPDSTNAQRLFPIQHCDITAPPFPDESFDLVVSNDVLEHVPDLQTGLRGMARLLRPGGIMLATFPFAYMDQATQVRAVVEDGTVKHLMEPSYHGDPVNPEAGVLVFSIPGWDILEMCRASGFLAAKFLFVSSEEMAITGAEISGILILRATKS